MSRRRESEGGGGPWYLLTGLLIGIAMGLLVAWGLYPVEYTNTAPYTLGAANKDAFRLLIAQSYLVNGDVGRAQGRLALLRDDNPIQALAEQAQRMLGKDTNPEAPRVLAQLASDLQQAALSPVPQAVAQAASLTPAPDEPRPQLSPSPTLEEVGGAIRSATPNPTETATPRATFPPRPSPPPRPTQGAPFAVLDKEKICDPDLPGPLLQVDVINAKGDPAGGVRVDVLWANGHDTFYTGLYPEISAGYADFNMDVGVVYSLQVGQGGEQVNNLETHTCKVKDGKDYPGGWMLRFNQP